MFFSFIKCLKNYQILFHRNTINRGVFFKPFLSVHLIVVSHKFSHTPYFKDYDDRKPIHNRIKELEDQGLGYRRIHKVLIDEGWEIGKTPSCVHTMIKKRKLRDEFLNQEVKCELNGVKVEVMRG